MQIEGWSVLFSNQLKTEHLLVAKRVKSLLHKKLRHIQQVLPASAVKKLKKIKIWVEWKENQYTPCATYHPGVQWLQERHLNPDMAGGIQITHANNFLDWTQRDQPMLVLHELAHAYHHQVLGFEQPDILEAFQKAQKSKKYERVQRYKSSPTRAYALTDEKEYFAESSEAYFGRNDFYPFNRSELQKHDPAIYQIIQAAWGVQQ
ncbi:MAG: hypothetical protein IV090_17450 [Candidatus Sericytochromatia bacterium]|nr:hypothetical protein [Candidatus Sericytochromatia bacterium]